jgi:hypothetical protein
MSTMHRILINIALNRMARESSNYLDYEIRVLFAECKRLLTWERS